MRTAILMAALLAPLLASAQGFSGDEPTCYSWEGGRGSAGSFSKCGPRWVVAAKPAPAPAAAPAPTVQAAPLPPLVSCAPAPKPVVKAKPKRKPAAPPKCTP